MKLDKKDMIFYAITDKNCIGENSFIEKLEDALKGGATFLQLREKEISEEEYLEKAKQTKKIADKYSVPFVINDNVEVAINSDASGVHIGQGDMDAKKARQLIGDDKILGVSANTVETAKLAEQNGADYIGVGAVFKTNTKKDANVISMEVLNEICNSVSIPVVAIGGINEETILDLKGTEIDGVCCISAVFGKENVFEASRHLYKLAKEIIKE